MISGMPSAFATGMHQVGGGQSGIAGIGGAAGKTGGASFADQLEGAINSASESQKVADSYLQGLGSGNDADLHNTMIALEEADIHLRSMVAVRDKVVDAYQTIMNMSI